MPGNEIEEFEFRARAEKEAASKDLPSQIPGVQPQVKEAKPPDPPSLWSRASDVAKGAAGLIGGRPPEALGGAVEAATSMATGIGAGAVGGLAGIYKGVTGGKFGTQEGVKEAQETAGKVAEAGTYQPRSESGKAILGGIGAAAEPFAALGPAVPFTAARAAKPAATAAESAATAIPRTVGEINAIAKSAEPWLAKKPPTVIQETIGRLVNNDFKLMPSKALGKDVLREEFGGQEQIWQQANLHNRENVNKIALKDLTASGNNVEQAIAETKKAAAIPYQKLREAEGHELIGFKFQLGDKYARQVGDIRKEWTKVEKAMPSLVSEKVTALKDDLANLKDEQSPSVLFDLSRRLREEAAENFKRVRAGVSTDSSIKELAQAQREAAMVIENALHDNLKALGKEYIWNDVNKGRIDFAKSYDYESALNPATGYIDARKIAMLDKKGEFLGKEMQIISDMAQSFPELVTPFEGERMEKIMGTPIRDIMSGGLRPLARKQLLSEKFQKGMAP